MAKIQLTNEEKIIKEYYGKIVSKNRIIKLQKKELIEFCNRYVKEVLKNTRFQNEIIKILDETDSGSAGSMSTAPNGQASKLTINFDYLLDKNALNSRNENTKFNAFVELVDTLNHETQHYFQSKEQQNFRITASGMKFSTCLEIIREHIATRTERDKFYSPKEGNYNDLYIEGDARRTGAVKTATQLLRAIPQMDGKKKNKLIKRVETSIKQDNVEFNELKYESSFEKYDRGDVTSAYVDEYVAAKPKILQEKEFSSLGFEYDTDGSRFSFEEVLELRDAAYETIKSNKKIKRETRQDMFRQVNSGFSQIMYNALRRSSPEKIIDIRRRIGDDKFIQEIDYIHTGKMNEIKEKVEKYNQYIEFFSKNRKIIDNKVFKSASGELDKLYEKTGYVVKIDEVTGEKYDTINSKQIEYLKRLGQKIIDTKDKYPLYTEEEIKESDEKRKDSKAKYVEEMKDMYAQRKFEHIKKREQEERIKQEQERAKREQMRREHMRKMKNPLYRVGYTISRIVQNSKRKKLVEAPSSSRYSKELYQKREDLEELNDKKELLQNRINNIKDESEKVLVEAENKVYLQKQEERDNIKEDIEEEKVFGKRDI